MKKFVEAHPILCTLFLALVTLLPAMASRDFTPSNELRYISLVDEAIEEGHTFAFTSHSEPYADKPPLYFWLMMLLRRIFGSHCMLALSMLSFIPACGIVCVMDKWLQTAFPGRFSPGQRAGAAMMLFTSGMFLGLALVLRMDMLMCLWIVLALWTFWRLDHGIGRRRLLEWALPLYIFLALFTKGPVGLLAPPLIIAVYLISERRARDIGKYLGLRTWGVIAALSAVWIGLAWAEGGSAYIQNLLFHQTVGRAVNAFHHKEPVWYYCWMIWCVLAPWCFLSVPAVAGGLRRGASGTERLLSLGCVAIFVMLSLFSSKLSVYLAPLFPLAVYLVPLVIDRLGWKRWMGRALGFAPGVLGLAGIVAAAGWALKPAPLEDLIRQYPFLGSPDVLAASLSLAAGGVAAFILMRRNDLKALWHRPVLATGCGLLLAVFFASLQMPRINDYLGYGGICAEVSAEGEVYTAGVKRPENMDVYLGREVKDLGKELPCYLPPSGTMIVPVGMLEQMQAGECKVRGNLAAVRLETINNQQI